MLKKHLCMNQHSKSCFKWNYAAKHKLPNFTILHFAIRFITLSKWLLSLFKKIFCFYIL